MKRVDEATIPRIARRLRHLRIAVAGDDRGAQVRFCKDIGILPQSWNGLEFGRTGRIGLDMAFKLVHRHGVTLDWLYLGDERSMGLMPHSLVQAIKRVEAEEASDPGNNKVA